MKILPNIKIPLMIILSIIIASPIYSQSLVEAAKKEKERRAKVSKPSKVINNETITEYLKGKEYTPGTIEQAGEASAASSEAKSPKSKEEEYTGPTDLYGRNESYWRNRIQEAKDRIKALESEAENLQSQMNAMRRAFYAIDDPNQRELLNVQINKTFELIDKNKAELEEAKKELENIREEGRKSGALPGWIYD